MPPLRKIVRNLSNVTVSEAKTLASVPLVSPDPSILVSFSASFGQGDFQPPMKRVCSPGAHDERYQRIAQKFPKSVPHKNQMAKIFQNEAACRDFLIIRNIFRDPSQCPSCGKQTRSMEHITKYLMKIHCKCSKHPLVTVAKCKVSAGRLVAATLDHRGPKNNTGKAARYIPLRVTDRNHPEARPQDLLCEAIWRLEHEHCLWEALLEALRTVRMFPAGNK